MSWTIEVTGGSKMTDYSRNGAEGPGDCEQGRGGHRRMWGWSRRHRHLVSGQEEEGDLMASLFSVLEEPRSGPAAWALTKAPVSPGPGPFT